MHKAKRYNMVMSHESYDALTAVAKEEGRLLADVIREAIEGYLKAKGHSVSTAVDRGGYRPRKEAKE
jgi:predicted DNA-binding protein